MGADSHTFLLTGSSEKPCVRWYAWSPARHVHQIGVCVNILSSLHPVEGEHRGYEVIVSVDLDQPAEVESVTPP